MPAACASRNSRQLGPERRGAGSSLAADPPSPRPEPTRHDWRPSGVECRSCSAEDADYIWTNERWRLLAPDKPMGLPVVVLLEPRRHYGEPGVAAELGVLLARVERAVRSVGEIGRVHVCRWGDGGEHLHWWLMGRPARIPQLIGSFAAIWDDIVLPTPEHIWRENIVAVATALNAT